MWRKISLAFVVAVIGGMILPIIEVDAQSTVDDSASCESSTFDEAVNLIREDLKDVKNRLGSNQQSSIKKDLEDLKVVCASNQQQNTLTELSSSKQALVSSLTCEYQTNLACLHFAQTKRS